jgi:hypothetical protein
MQAVQFDTEIEHIKQFEVHRSQELLTLMVLEKQVATHWLV